MTGRPRIARSPRLTWYAAALAGAALLLATACGSNANGASDGTGTTVAAARPSTPATLQIVSPAPNDRTGRDVNVTMRLGHAHLAPPTQTGGVVRPDEGHIHLSVDGRLVAMPLRLAERLAPLSPGSHTVEAEFVASDHLPFDNRVVAAATFDVR